MAIYHLQVQNISRGKGKSAISAAAYRSGCAIKDEAANKTYNYSRKERIYNTKILTPPNAPDWASDRQKLWNTVEISEKRKDSRLAKEFNIALPKELSHEAKCELLEKWVTDQFVSKGLIADLAYHDFDTHNPHAHVMLTTRVIEQDGFKLKLRECDSKNFIEQSRSTWADYANDALAKSGSSERIDYRSLEEQGIAPNERIPQIHLGHKVIGLANKGIHADHYLKYLEIEAANQILTFNRLKEKERLEREKQEREQQEREQQERERLKRERQEQEQQEREQQEQERQERERQTVEFFEKLIEHNNLLQNKKKFQALLNKWTELTDELTLEVNEGDKWFEKHHRKSSWFDILGIDEKTYDEKDAKHKEKKQKLEFSKTNYNTCVSNLKLLNKKDAEHNYWLSSSEVQTILSNPTNIKDIYEVYQNALIILNKQGVKKDNRLVYIAKTYTFDKMYETINIRHKDKSYLIFSVAINTNNKIVALNTYGVNDTDKTCLQNAVNLILEKEHKEKLQKNQKTNISQPKPRPKPKQAQNREQNER